MESRARRTGAKVRPHEGFGELARLRREGKTRLSTYEVKQEEDVYEEVDEDEYKKEVRRRLDEDDFVVDDGGEGYVDNGMDDWGADAEQQFSSNNEAEEEGGKKLSKKELKRKRDEEKERKEQQEGALHKYFLKSAALPAKAKPVTTKKDREFMDDLLGAFDTTPLPKGSAVKRAKVESARKQRRLSPPRSKPQRKQSAAAMRSSPPPIDAGDLSDYGEDITFDMTEDNEDVTMGDAPVPPSSPAAKAAERKIPNLKYEEDDDDDDLAVAEIKVNKNIRAAKVNISSTRPANPQPIATAPKKATPIDSSTWTSIGGGLNVITSKTVQEAVPAGRLSPQDAAEPDGSIKMFWIDYTEANGSLILFGKVKDKRTSKYVSAFLKVDGMMRNLFFLPREYRIRGGRETDEEVEMQDVYSEVSDIMVKQRFEFKSKPCSRKYAFELPNIPKEGDYLKVLYPYTSK